MAIDLRNGYRELLRYIGKDVSVASWGDGEEPFNVAIVCDDTDEVLLDFNHPEMEDLCGYSDVETKIEELRNLKRKTVMDGYDAGFNDGIDKVIEVFLKKHLTSEP